MCVYRVYNTIHVYIRKTILRVLVGSEYPPSLKMIYFCSILLAK